MILPAVEVVGHLGAALDRSSPFALHVDRRGTAFHPRESKKVWCEIRSDRRVIPEGRANEKGPTGLFQEAERRVGGTRWAADPAVSGFPGLVRPTLRLILW